MTRWLLASLLVSALGWGLDAPTFSARIYRLAPSAEGADWQALIASPGSQESCGYVAWCCYRIQCTGWPDAHFRNDPICPRQHGVEPYNLTGAWTVWVRKITLEVRKMHKERGHVACAIKELGCFDEPSSYCPTYPPGYPG